MVSHETLRRAIAKEQVDPDQYRKERGRCPRGYKFDGEKCVKTVQEGEDGAPADETAPPKGKGGAEPKQTGKPAAKKPKAPKKPKVQPQGPVEKVTKDNPYGLDQKTRSAATLADLGGHEAITKVLGHLDPSKRPPPDIDPSTIKLNLDGDNDSKALMTWRDPKGRLQAAYTPKFLNRNAAVKWERVKQLEQKADAAVEKFDEILGDESKSPKDRDAAAIMSIIGKTGLRPGSMGGLKSTGHRGISTLSAKNVKVEGGTVQLEFVGKSGKLNKTKISDPKLAAYLQDKLKGKGEDDLLFEAREKDLPGVMKAAGVGAFKPKDFRTRMAGKIAAQTMADLADPPPPMPDSPKKAKKLVELRIKEASTKVADQLNNTPAMARKAYINPAIFQSWAESVGAGDFLAAASLLVAEATKPTADELWKKSLEVTLPDADKTVSIDPELEDDDQLDSVPEPTVKQDADRAIGKVAAKLVQAGHRDLARRLVSFD